MLFEPIKERGIAKEPVLDDLGDARPQFARRQSRQGGGIRDHSDRLMECTDQILTAGVVHARLAAH